MTDRRDTERTDRPERSRLVPEWLENLAALSWRVLVIVGLLVVLGYLTLQIWTITAAIILAIVVAAVFSPLVLRLLKNGRSRTAAAGIGWLAAVGSIGGLLLLLAIALVPTLVEIVQRVNEGAEAFQQTIDDAGVPDWVAALAQDLIAAARAAAGEGDLVGQIVATVADIGGILILATFLLFFFLRDGDKAWLWLFQSLAEEKREAITTAGDKALTRVGGYLRDTSILALVNGATSYLFLVLLDVPAALGLSLLSFAAAFIPYFGGLISGVAILLVTLGAHDVGVAALMAGLLAGRGVLVHYLLRPRFFGQTVPIHPALVLIALPAGYELAGLVGLFAAVPVAALVVTTASAAIDLLEPDDPPSLPELVPAWLDRAAQWSWRGLVALALVALLVLIITLVPLLVVPLVVAMIFAATLAPLVARLVQRGQSRNLASAVSVLGSTVIIVGVLALAMVSLVAQAPELADAASTGAEEIDDAAGGTLGVVSEAVNTGARATASFIVDLGASLTLVTVVLLLAVGLTFLFLRDGAGMWDYLMSHTRPGAREELTAAGRRSVDVLGGYMIGTGAISLVGAGSQLVIMWVLGLPLVLPVFVLSFFGGYIPYIGSALTTLLAFFIAVAFGDPIDILIMLIWTLVFNIVQGNIVAPLVYGRTAHIHPAIVLVAIPAASMVAGILGMFVVVPVLGVVAGAWRTVLAYLGGEDDYRPPEPAPPDAEDAETAPEPT
jgi:predicted PurR-regulated permease PerM